MIAWPDNGVLTPTAVANMDRFKKTSLSHQLEEDAHTWKFQSWAWTRSGPWRWILESDAHRMVTVAMNQDETWLARWTEPDLAGHP